MLALLLALTPAWAACSVTLTAPTSGTTQIQTPTFRWLGTCTSYRLRVSPSSTFTGADSYTTPWRAPKTFRMDEELWDTYQAGGWAGGVYYQVQGRDSTGVVTSTTGFLAMDPNYDDDAFSVAGGDCDDRAAAVYPGAAEVCNDGIDNNCDGGPSGCGLSGTISLATADTIIRGEAAGDQLGYAATFVADVDGDGYDDLIAGAPSNDAGGSNAGAAYIFYGPLTSGALSASTADAKVTGLAASDGLGASFSAPGDINGDGFGDLLVGIDAYEGSSGAEGTVYVYYGPITGTVSPATADATIIGEDVGDELGFSMTAACDVNGDGFGDLLMGGPDSDPNGRLSGGAWLLYGPLYGAYDVTTADADFAGEARDDTSGHAVTCAGDTNGDGFDDIVIGGDENDAGGTDAGAAYLYLGPVSGSYVLSSTTADTKLIGEDANDGAAIALAGGADLTGDGLDDLVVTAPLAEDAPLSNSGLIYVIPGPIASGSVDLSTAAIRISGAVSNDQAGTFAATAGDVNGDGYADLLIGARRSDANGVDSGVAHVLYGPLTASTYSLGSASITLPGEATGDLAGWAGAIAGDVNGDGVDDIVVGAPKADVSGTDAGAIYVILGEGP